MKYGKLSAGKLVFLVSTLFLASTAIAADNEAAPTLKVTAIKAGGVLVRWTPGRLLPSTKPVLELQRSNGGAFATVAQFEHPGGRRTYRDTGSTNGTFSYRARILSSRGESVWSNVASIAVSNTVPTNPGSNPPTGGGNGACQSVQLPAGITECPSGYEQQVFSAVNAARRQSLAMNTQLNCSARTHTINMIKANKMSHANWDSEIRTAGYSGGAISQNVAVGFRSPSSVMQAWMGSTGHRANILGGFSDIGVSCLIGNGTLWWTQNFGG